jgi:hypothetical protein
MWILSPDAGTLLSVVQFDAKKAPKVADRHGATQPGVDYLLIRARHKPSLEYLCDVLDALRKGEAEGYARPLVDTDKKADYHYRTVITRDEWKQYVMYEVDGIDYGSHVKEETVRRQPEPKIADGELYKALSATWTAWAALQPDRPYSGLPSWTGSSAQKPDCKHCGQRELNHRLTWDSTQKKNVYGGCFDSKVKCPGYEPKPVQVTSWVAQPACECGCPELRHKMHFEKGVRVYGKCNGIWNSNISKVTPCPTNCAVYSPPPVVRPEPVDDVAPLRLDYSVEEYGEVPAEVDEAWASELFIGPDGFSHPAWCAVFDGDSCICGEASEHGQAEAEEAEELAALERLLDAHAAAELAANPPADGEPAPRGESKRARKARQQRNRRARRRAGKGV